MDAIQLRGLIWSALQREGLDVLPAQFRGDADLRGLIVSAEGREWLVLVGEFRREGSSKTECQDQQAGGG